MWMGRWTYIDGRQEKGRKTDVNNRLKNTEMAEDEKEEGNEIERSR